jgi:F-type H+-transporting ATPase subunit delta
MASVVGTYARAFVEVVLDRRLDPGQVLGETQALAALVGTSKLLREVWEAPSIPALQKRGLLDAIAARQGISKESRNFLAVLIDHRRIPLLEPIVKQFEQDLNRRLGFTEAEISSARELSEPERRALEAQVEVLTGKKVRARYTRDESLLGGAVVRVGSTIYDGSVKGKLERMREQLVSG